MREPLVTYSLIISGSILDIPVVYQQVRDDESLHALPLALGLISMGLAWAAGCSLENRRKGTVAALLALGIVQPLLVVIPLPGVILTPTSELLLVVSAASAGLGAVLLARRWRRAVPS